MRIEEIFDKSIQRYKNGEEISAIVSSYPEEQAELQAMLSIVSVINSLPKRAIPTPTKRRLYIQHQPVRGFQGIFNSLRLTPFVFASFILLVTGTALGAQASLPGDKLFSVKKSYENLQVKMATNPEARAKLQLEIAAQRFEEAQKVLATKEDPESKKQAIEELNMQTSAALSDLKEVAVSISAKNPEIVARAESLTKNQNKLIEKVSANISEQVANKNNENKIAISDIKKLIAASNEESNATIQPTDKITIAGPITAINSKDKSIVVAKNTFIIDKDTEITDKAGQNLNFEDLFTSDIVEIQATIKDNKNIATSVSTINKVKIEKQDKTEKEQPKQKEKEKEKTEVRKKPSIDDSAPTVEPVPLKPTDTFGGFILEPPASFSNDN